MSVRIRLTRTGRSKVSTYRVVVADSRSPRDGKFIEIIGRYDPRPDPSVVEIDNEKAVKWLMQGAQPSEPVRKLLEISGALEQFRALRGGRSSSATAKQSGGKANSRPASDSTDSSYQQREDVGSGRKRAGRSK